MSRTGLIPESGLWTAHLMFPPFGEDTCQKVLRGTLTSLTSYLELISD